MSQEHPANRQVDGQYHEPDPWEYHWLYRDNNSGFGGLHTHWNSEVKCHFWQYAYIERGFWQEYGIESEADMNAEEYQDMIGCRGTENYYIWFDNWFIENVLKPELGDQFRISQNEQCCAYGYHNFLRENIYDPQGIPQNRLYTSFDAHEFETSILRAEWYWSYRNNIFSRYMPDVHKINTLEKYETAKARKTYEAGNEYYLVIPDRRVLISTDGTGRWPEIDRKTGQVISWRHDELERLTDAIYADGNDFERIEWLPNNCNFAELDWIGAAKMRDKALSHL